MPSKHRGWKPLWFDYPCEGKDIYHQILIHPSNGWHQLNLLQSLLKKRMGSMQPQHAKSVHIAVLVCSSCHLHVYAQCHDSHDC